MLRLSDDGGSPATLLLYTQMQGCLEFFSETDSAGRRTLYLLATRPLNANRGGLLISDRRCVVGCKMPSCCKQSTCLTSEGRKEKDVHVESEETGLKKESADRDAWHDSAYHGCKVFRQVTQSAEGWPANDHGDQK